MTDTTRVRMDCQYAGGQVTSLYADLDTETLTAVVDRLRAVQAGDLPPGELVEVTARHDPDDHGSDSGQLVRAWRIVKVLQLPASVVLFERHRRAVYNGPDRDLLEVALTDEQLEAVRAGAVVHVDLPGPDLTVAVTRCADDAEGQP